MSLVGIELIPGVLRLVSALEKIGVQPEVEGSSRLASRAAFVERWSMSWRLICRDARPERTLSKVPTQNMSLRIRLRHRTSHCGGRRLWLCIVTVGARGLEVSGLPAPYYRTA